jgi:hypothetical protein
LFPQKIGNSFNGCPLKAVVIDGHSNFTTEYVKKPGSSAGYVRGLEAELLTFVLEQINMSFILIPTTKDFESEEGSVVVGLINGMIGKKIYIALGGLGTHLLSISFFDSTNTHYLMSFSWYVPCSDKYPRWSSILRIFSVELWLVLTISIVIAAILATLIGRYSCTSEWQVYKTVVSTLTNVWAVILGVPVSTMPRAPSLKSLFLAWVCFSVAFITVFKAFFISFLIDPGYKTPIQHMDELFDSGIKLAYHPENSYIFETRDEAEASRVQKNRLNCPSFEVCVDWAMYDKNGSILVDDGSAEIHYALGNYMGGNYEQLLCRLEDGVVFTTGLSMIMFYGDPLMKRVSEIIDRVVEAGIYNYWISTLMNKINVDARKIAIVHPLDGYYSFNLYHMQPAFYLLLVGLCLSAICFIVEFLYNRKLSNRNSPATSLSNIHIVN